MVVVCLYFLLTHFGLLIECWMFPKFIFFYLTWFKVECWMYSAALALYGCFVICTLRFVHFEWLRASLLMTRVMSIGGWGCSPSTFLDQNWPEISKQLCPWMSELTWADGASLYVVSWVARLSILCVVAVRGFRKHVWIFLCFCSRSERAKRTSGPSLWFRTSPYWGCQLTMFVS